MFFFALIAFIVGVKPAYPTRAVSTTSMFSPSTISSKDFLPANTFIPKLKRASLTSLYLSSFVITTIFGINFFDCSIKRVALLFAVKTSTPKRSGCSEITSSACVPIEPVEPRIAMFFLFIFIYFF